MDINDIVNNPIYPCNNAELAKQLQLEHDLILGKEEYKNQLQVLPIEAAGFKSLQMERSLAYYYLTGQNASTLVVKKFIPEGAASVKKINDYAGEAIACLIISEEGYKKHEKTLAMLKINTLFIIKYVKPDDSKTVKAQKKKHNDRVYKTLCNYYIVIIMHEKYVMLANKGMKQIKNYLKKYKETERKNLIIDEEPPVFENHIIKLDKNLIDELGKKVKRNYKKIYDQFTMPLINCLTIYENSPFSFFRSQKVMNGKKLDNWKIATEKGKELLVKKREAFLNKTEKNKEMIIKEMNNILSFYYNKGIYVRFRKSVFYINKNIKFWLFENNIILDACGSFNPYYKILDSKNRSFCHVHDINPCLDYSMFNMNFVKVNTTESSKEAIVKGKDGDCSIKKAEKINRKVIEHILKYNNAKEDKVLIITRKDYEKDIETLLGETEGIKSTVEVAYFWNLVGRNNWRDFNRCYILDTPYLPFHVYVLKAIGYRNHTLLAKNKEDIEFKNRKNRFQGENNIFENIKYYSLLIEIYQGLLRVDRNHDMECQIYLLTSEENIINNLLKLMPGAVVKNNSNLVIKTIYDEKREALENERLRKAKDLLFELNYFHSKCKYNKSEIYNMLNGTREKYDFIWGNKEFKEYCLSMNISIKNHKLVFNSLKWGINIVPGRELDYDYV